MADDNWCVEASDDETYNPGRYSLRVWEPLPDDIVGLYTKLSEDANSVQLSWVMPGRRSPEPDKMEVEVAQEDKQSDYVEERPAEKTEFDFDDASETSVVTPRRTPGHSKTPKSQKRVATMDNILGNLFNKNKNSPSTTPSRPSTNIKARPMPFS